MAVEPIRPRVLVVDDNASTCSLIRSILDGQYDIMAANSGREALKILREEAPPHLILLDIIMPEMDGYAVYRDIRKDKRLANIPIIFATALDDPISELKGLECGAIDYITKPFDKSILLVRVETAIELHAIFNTQMTYFPELELDYDDEFMLYAPPAIKGDEPPPEDRPASIISIDDNQEIRRLIELGLKKTYQVVSFESAEAAFAYLDNRPEADLVLLDIAMPKINGFEAIRRLKMSTATADIPIIFLTALNDTENEIRGFQAGAVDFVHKPISLPVLTARIRNQLLLDWKRKQLKTRMAPFIDE